MARSHVEVALKHPIKLIANALGSPPKDVIDQVHAAGVPMTALPGHAKTAPATFSRRTASTSSSPRVTRPAVIRAKSRRWCWCRRLCDAVAALGLDTAVLAAGGIGSGRQVAAALALGAQGVWMGPAFLHRSRIRPRRTTSVRSSR